MKTIRLYDLVGRKVLVTRDSARSIQPYLAAALEGGDREVALDFEGVDGMTPSFLDEILSVIEEQGEDASEAHFSVIVKNPPTALSAKFAAVGRGHGLTIKESSDVGWTLKRERTEPNAK